MNLLITVNKKQICNFAFINVISKIIISKALISIVVVTMKRCRSKILQKIQHCYIIIKIDKSNFYF